MKFVLPLVMLMIGVGAGVGAGVYMRPSSHPETDTHAEEAPPAQEAHDTAHDERHTGHGSGEVEYVKLNNQFVVPIVKERDVAAMVPLDRLLIETDSPYLAPVPYRGKTNNPSFVPWVAKQLAEIRQVPLETIAESTNANFDTLFKGIFA